MIIGKQEISLLTCGWIELTSSPLMSNMFCQQMDGWNRRNPLVSRTNPCASDIGYESRDPFRSDDLPAKGCRREEIELSVGMGVSKNRGTPKSSILIGFSIVNHPFWGTPIFENTQMS